MLLNDPLLNNFISANFIPVAGAVEQLQPSRYGNSETETSLWFKKTADVAFRKWAPKNWWKTFKTYQGVYVLDPGGNPYLYKVVWKQTSKELLSDLKSALSSYNSHFHGKVVVKNRQVIDASLMGSPLAGTSVIRVYSRLSPLPKTATDSERSVGRDNMWILKKEVKSIVGLVKPANVWKKLPSTLVARMVRFHLLNNSGNVGYMFSEKEVKNADFKICLTKIEGSKNFYKFVGKFSSLGSDKNWGKSARINGNIEGTLSIDRASLKVLTFRAYGSGIAKGGNDSVSKKQLYPIKFAFQESQDDKIASIPPFAYGLSPIFRNVYLNPKISH